MNKYNGLLTQTQQVGRELISLLVEADIKESNELKHTARVYQELADLVQALAIAAEVSK